MAASLLVQQESGTYTGRIRHSHNGYFAGDFSQTPRSGSGLGVAYAQGRGVPRAEAQYGAHGLAASAAIPDPAELGCTTPVRVHAPQQ
jgi:hypothetical protein